MSEYRIAIVNSSSFGRLFPDHIARLQALGEVKRFEFDQQIPGRDLAEALSGFNLIIASVTPFFDAEFFAYKDELQLLSRHGIGYNNVDLQAAKAHGTVVAIVPALVERDAVAENNVTNLLGLMRCTPLAYQAVKKDHWENRAQFVGHSLFNKRVGIIGLGNTGSAVAEALRQGFRCDVMAYDPYKSELDMAQYGVQKVDYPTLLKTADVICLCANLTEENYHMVDEEAFAMMKPGVYLSNSARGALIDQEALIHALTTGRVAGFATDVLEVEPARADHPLLAFDNVIVTPHTSAYTMECIEKMGDKCVTDCEQIVNGQLPVRAMQAISPYVKAKTVESN